MPDTQAWTILLIGGGSTAGKTSLAESLAARLDARYIDLDLFWIVLQRSLPPDLAPELHLLDGDDVWREDPNVLVEHFFEVSRFVCRAIEPVVAHHHMISRRVVIEGCWIHPEFVTQGDYAGSHVDDIRGVFLHEPDIDAIEARIRGRPHRWLERLPYRAQRNHLEMQRLYGEAICAQARALGLAVVPSQPFETLEARAIEACRLLS